MSRTLLTSQHGFAMPAEWTPHVATWMAWPCDDELWVGELEPVRREFAELVRAVASFEPVELLVRDAAAESDAAARLAGANVRLHRVPYDDVWLRDSGPIFVAREGRLRLVNWEFNGWGGKYNAATDNEVPRQVARILGTTTVDTGVVMEGGSIEVNGEGCVLTTRQCLLTPTRNPSLSEAEIEAALAAYLGTPRVLWLDTGLEGDHTDGHIDTITRFTDPQTIVTVTCEDRSDANYEPTAVNLERLRGFSDADGQPFRHRGAAAASDARGVRRRAPSSHVCQLLRRERRAHRAGVWGCERRTRARDPAPAVPRPRGARRDGTAPHHGRRRVPLRDPAAAGRRSDQGAMTTRTLTIAVVQMAMTDDVERNVQHAIGLVRQAADRGARLVLLPELFENLYWCQVQRESYFAHAHPVDGHPFLRAVLRRSPASWGSSCPSASSSGAARPTTTVSP